MKQKLEKLNTYFYSKNSGLHPHARSGPAEPDFFKSNFSKNELRTFLWNHIWLQNKVSNIVKYRTVWITPLQQVPPPLRERGGARGRWRVSVRGSRLKHSALHTYSIYRTQGQLSRHTTGFANGYTLRVSKRTDTLKRTGGWVLQG